MSLTVLVDYDSGNLHSAQKAFERMAREAGHGAVVVTSEPDVVARADRIVLPGDGAFPSCRAALIRHTGLFEAVDEAVTRRAVPFMGICIGMQMLATRGLEFEPTPGFGWIGGEVVRITPADATLKVPHMGWNDLVLDHAHPVLDGIAPERPFLFCALLLFRRGRDAADAVARTHYGIAFTSAVARDNIFATQFHPEKSAAAGLQLLANFVRWKP